MTFMGTGFSTMVILGGLIGTAVGFSEMVIKHEDRLGFAKASRRILLVEVTAAEESPPEQSAGFTSRQLSVRGRVLEVIRGDAGEGRFLHQVDLLELTDHGAFEAATGRPPGDLERSMTPDRDDTGVKECEVGARVLVIDIGKTENLPQILFYRLPVDDDSWRAKVPDFDPELRARFDR